MKNGNIDDSQITVSTFLTSNSGKQYSEGRLDSKMCWAARSSDKSPWIQVNLLKPKIMSGIVTQGDGSSNHPDWVSSLSVAFTNDTSVANITYTSEHLSWFTFMYENCTEMVCISNISCQLGSKCPYDP